jgi:hypothetical protein
MEHLMSTPKAIEGAMNHWNSIEAALRAANPGASEDDLYHATAKTMNQTLGLRRSEEHLVFDDGIYSVWVGHLFATIARKGGATFHVPAGHAWFERVAQADTALLVEARYAELIAAVR